MARPQRLEYPDAHYHVTARGVGQGAIFIDDRDRACLVSLLARALRACDAQAFAFCLMGNHYHLVLRTRQANLSVLMRRVNSAYSLAFNQRHDRRGHVFEGRFKALHVDRDAYLLQACRYVDLNPVRAGLVASADQWDWSSYRVHVGMVPELPWLATRELLGVLAGCEPEAPGELELARRAYAEWVGAGRGVQLWKESLRDGLYLGDEAFVARLKQHHC